MPPLVGKQKKNFSLVPIEIKHNLIYQSSSRSVPVCQPSPFGGMDETIEIKRRKSPQPLPLPALKVRNQIKFFGQVKLCGNLFDFSHPFFSSLFCPPFPSQRCIDLRTKYFLVPPSNHFFLPSPFSKTQKPEENCLITKFSNFA